VFVTSVCFPDFELVGFRVTLQSWKKFIEPTDWLEKSKQAETALWTLH
jgi:hypothetical protein